MEIDKTILTDPSKFHAELAKIAEEAAPADDEEESQEEAEQLGDEEEAQEDQAAADNEEEAEGEQEQEEAEEDASDDDDIEVVQTDKGKMVPKSRLDKEIEKRQAETRAERDARIAAETKLANFEKAMELYYRQDQEKQEDTDADDLQPLDPETDARTQKKIKELEDKIEKGEKEAAAKNAFQSYHADIVRQESDYKTKVPDLQDALEHVFKTELAKNSLLLDEDQAKQATVQYMQNVMAVAWKDGKNVPDTLYKMAKNLGYQGKKVGSGKAAPDLNAIAANMKKSKSIASMPNASAGLSANDYTRPDHFQKLKGKHGEVDKAKFAEILRKVQSGAA